MANDADKPKSDVPSVEAQANPLVIMTANHLEQIAMSLVKLGEITGNRQLGFTAANLMAVLGGLVEYRRTDTAERLANHIAPFVEAEEARARSQLSESQAKLADALCDLMRVVASAKPAGEKTEKK